MVHNQQRTILLCDPRMKLQTTWTEQNATELVVHNNKHTLTPVVFEHTLNFRS